MTSQNCQQPLKSSWAKSISQPPSPVPCRRRIVFGPVQILLVTPMKWGWKTIQRKEDCWRLKGAKNKKVIKVNLHHNSPSATHCPKSAPAHLADWGGFCPEIEWEMITVISSTPVGCKITTCQASPLSITTRILARTPKKCALNQKSPIQFYTLRYGDSSSTGGPQSASDCNTQIECVSVWWFLEYTGQRDIFRDWFDAAELI